MDNFDQTYTQLANEHVLHTNDHFRTSSFRAIYNHFYLDRPIIPTIPLNPIDFGKYGLYPDRLIANLGWSSLPLSQAYTCYLDAVYQFYTNLRLEGNLHRGKLSTFVDGHIIYVTPNLLSQVLAHPRVGVSIFDESDFALLNFNPGAALSNWTGDSYSSFAYASNSALPNSLKLFHYFLTSVFLPRSVGRFLVTLMDTWLMHCATIGVEVDFSTLMFTAMTHFGNHLQEGDLSFGGAVSALIERLGIRFHTHFATGGDTLDIRPQHILRRIGWSGCPPLNGSGGEGPMDADELATDTERRLHIWSGVDNASNYASSPEWMI
ncbi:hypothetical protein LINPERPRIM_LOCUS21410 [Linum perenne]